MKVSILTSGMGFGIYIPALILRNQLIKQNIKADIEIIEKLFTEEKQNKLCENQKAFHKDLRTAKTGMKLSLMQQRNNYNPSSIQELLDKWKREERIYFIVFSGSWQFILEEYKKYYNHLHIYCIHLDTTPSPSWKNFSMTSEKVFWALGTGNGISSSAFIIEENMPIPFEERKKRIIVHGGGWGIGISDIKENLLNPIKYEIYLITTNRQEIEEKQNRSVFYTGAWQAWDSEEMTFPPLYSEKQGVNLNSDNRHYVYQLEKDSKAIISKAGGATLLESFSGAIPIIFTVPIAKHEEQNKNDWIKYGFGVTLEEWEESCFSEELIRRCYQNLMKAREKVTSFLQKEIVEWMEA